MHTPPSAPRRFYLLMARASDDAGLELGFSLRASQRELPGEPLPALLPGRATLVAAGYLAIEDVRGAEIEELTDLGLSHSDAKAVLAVVNA